MSQSPAKLNLTELTNSLMEALDERSRDIIKRRFAIKTDEVETLESIGKEYGITRERVRQIESQGKKILMNLEQSLQPVTDAFKEIFVINGGLLADDHIVALSRQTFGSILSAAHVYLYLEILPGYKHISRDTTFGPHWRHQDVNSAQAVAVAEAAADILKQEKHPVVEEKLLEQIIVTLKATSETLPKAQLKTYLIASKHVGKTPFGEWGLSNWSETSPRGVGDKAYAVLRRHNKPEHFTHITDLINQASFDHKQANPQTVHNELIKDGRFVLVGRGLYGLAEWGYIPGTVADVLESLLKRTNDGLTRDELIEQVLEQRQVKKNTILLGLQNEKRFLKTPENRYVLRQK